MNPGTVICSVVSITTIPAANRYATLTDHLEWAKLWWKTVSPRIEEEKFEIHIGANAANTPTAFVFALKFDVPRTVDMFAEITTGAGSMSFPWLSHVNGADLHSIADVYTGDEFKFGATTYSTSAAWVAAVTPTHPVVLSYIHTPTVNPTPVVPTTDLGALVTKILNSSETLEDLIQDNKQSFADNGENLLRIYEYSATDL